MKQRLIAGTINNWRDDDEWVNVTLDINKRGIYDAATDSFVAPDVIADLSKGLPMFREEMFDEVRCHHVFEHLTLEQAHDAAAAIYFVLKKGGIFDIALPDMDAVCRAWVDGSVPKEDLQKWIYGEQLPNHEPGDSHRYGFWREKLVPLLTKEGFDPVETWVQPGLEMRYHAHRPESA